MKYIVFEKTILGMKQEIPIIFPNLLVHLDVAKALTKVVETSRIVAAGEFSSLDIDAEVGGKSTSIGIKSRGKKDEILIAYCDYTGGM